MWLRRRHEQPPAATAADVERLLTRLESFERRLDDLEDLAAAALAPDRVDDLTARVHELAATAVTVDDLLELRLESARMIADALGRTVVGGDARDADATTG